MLFFGCWAAKFGCDAKPQEEGEVVFRKRAVESIGVEQALRSLPAEQQEVVTLKEWGGLTFAEIASALEIPPGTAASRYRLALARLKETLLPALS